MRSAATESAPPLGWAGPGRRSEVDSTGGRIDFDEIRDLLPQKFPFLMIDRVVAIEKGKKVVAFKNITGNELFFPGHFPAMAVMPGALIIESMAQAAIILFRKRSEERRVG